MYVDFDVPRSKTGTTYRIEGRGYQWYRDPTNPFMGKYRWGKSQFDDIVTLSGNENALSHTFWFDPARNPADDPFIYDSYKVAIYKYNPSTQRDVKWVA